LVNHEAPPLTAVFSTAVLLQHQLTLVLLHAGATAAALARSTITRHFSAGTPLPSVRVSPSSLPVATVLEAGLLAPLRGAPPNKDEARGLAFAATDILYENREFLALLGFRLESLAPSACSLPSPHNVVLSEVPRLQWPLRPAALAACLVDLAAAVEWPLPNHAPAVADIFSACQSHRLPPFISVAMDALGAALGHSLGASNDNAFWHAVFLPSARAACLPDSFVESGGVIVLATVPQLYKVFERTG
jgi:hypothetical protein